MPKEPEYPFRQEDLGTSCPIDREIALLLRREHTRKMGEADEWTEAEAQALVGGWVQIISTAENTKAKFAELHHGVWTIVVKSRGGAQRRIAKSDHECNLITKPADLLRSPRYRQMVDAAIWRKRWANVARLKARGYDVSSLERLLKKARRHDR